MLRMYGIKWYMSDEWWITKDLEGICCDLLEEVFPAFTQKD
jgi:hypothetical protein